jgi:GDSL-like Lipase/Acylhydrolase family/N-terminus of Esterase_SGNH_hydro-type
MIARRVFLASLLATPLLPAEPELRWLSLPAPELEIDGLPWFGQNGGEFFRLPAASKEKFPPAVWNLAKSPSGARIRFRTDSTSLAVRLEYPSAPNMSNMHAFGQTGVDLYSDGIYWNTAIADKEAKPGKIYEHAYYSARPRAWREATLYLSLYMPVKVISVGVDREARFEKATSFSRSKAVVFYGTSITQGGCASRPGMSYQAILGRMLNIDFVNLGFSGAGKGEPDVAAAVAQIDASCFVLDFAVNNRTVASLREVYAPFIETLRRAHPETPILAITPIYSTRELNGGTEHEGMREHIRQVVSQRIAAGDRNLQLVEGTDLLGSSRGDGLVDGTHPNDLGFQWMADGLAPRLRRMLGL